MTHIVNYLKFFTGNLNRKKNDTESLEEEIWKLMKYYDILIWLVVPPIPGNRMRCLNE